MDSWTESSSFAVAGGQVELAGKKAEKNQT
jgi:hypothetical protein